MVFRAQIAEIVSAKFMCSVLELEDREGFLPVFRDLWVCLIGLNGKLSIRLIPALKTICVSFKAVELNNSIVNQKWIQG